MRSAINTAIDLPARLFSKKGYRIALFLLVVIGSIVIRLYYVQNFPVEQTSDFRAYYASACNLLEHGFYGAYASPDRPTAYFPPGYAFFLFGLFKLFGASTFVGVMGNVCLSGIYTVLIFLFGRECGRDLSSATDLRGFYTGIASASIYAISPTFIMMNGLLGTENLFSPLLLGGLLCLVVAGRISEEESRHRLNWKSVCFLILSGCCFGFASLTRSIVLLIPAMIITWWLLEGIKPKTLILRFLVLCLSMGCVILPWTLRNYSHFQRLIPVSTNGGVNFYIGNNELRNIDDIPRKVPWRLKSGGELEKSDEGFRRGVKYIKANPFNAMVDCYRKLHNLYAGSSFTIRYSGSGIGKALENREYFDKYNFVINLNAYNRFFYCFLFLGTWTALVYPRARSGPEKLLWLILLYWTVIHVVFFAKDRFRYPIEALMPILVSCLLFKAKKRSVDRD